MTDHFVALAKAINSTMPVKNTITDQGAVAYWQWHKDMMAIANVCASYNGNFDLAKFVSEACKGEI